MISNTSFNRWNFLHKICHSFPSWPPLSIVPLPPFQRVSSIHWSFLSSTLLLLLKFISGERLFIEKINGQWRNLHRIPSLMSAYHGVVNWYRRLYARLTTASWCGAARYNNGPYKNQQMETKIFCKTNLFWRTVCF